MALGGKRNFFWFGLIHQAIHLARFADVPVLAELARQVAPGSAEGEHAAAGIEMRQRFFLDWVDAKTRRAAIGGEDHLTALHLAHEAGAALAFVQLAVARAQVALDAAIVEFVPPAAGIMGISGHACFTSRAGSGSFHLLTV